MEMQSCRVAELQSRRVATAEVSTNDRAIWPSGLPGRRGYASWAASLEASWQTKAATVHLMLGHRSLQRSMRHSTGSGVEPRGAAHRTQPSVEVQTRRVEEGRAATAARPCSVRNRSWLSELHAWSGTFPRNCEMVQFTPLANSQ